MKILLVLLFTISSSFAAESKDVKDIVVAGKELTLSLDLLEKPSLNEIQLKVEKISPPMARNLNRQLQEVAMGDKEGNGGDYALAELALRLNEFFLYTYSGDSVYLKHIVKRSVVLRDLPRCIILTKKYYFFNQSCLASKKFEDSKKVIFPFLLDFHKRLRPFEYVDNISLINKNEHKDIKNLDSPEELLTNYLIGSKTLEILANYRDLKQLIPNFVMTDFELQDSRGATVCGLHDGEDNIFIQKSCWTDASSFQRLLLTTHEYLRFLRVPDDHYFNTIQIIQTL